MPVDEKARELARKAFWDGHPGIYGADECLDEAIAAYEAAKSSCDDEGCPHYNTPHSHGKSAHQPVGSASLLEALTALEGEADNYYCRGIDMAQRTLCCGEAIKLERGDFGQPELDAHRKCSETMAWHFAIYHAVKKIREALKATPERESVDESYATVDE